jgi:hypothetical protein
MSDEINENAQTPRISQITKTGREVYYKEHEFREELLKIIAELDALLDNSENSTSIIAIKQREIIQLLSEQASAVSDLILITENKIALILNELINVDSAHERLYQKILADILLINANIKNRTRVYDIAQAYNTSLKDYTYSRLAYKSPYKAGLADRSENDKWTIRSPKSLVMLRDMDMGDRMVSFPFILDPEVTQDTPIKIFSFTPIKNTDNSPVFLSELIINGDLYAFKGYLKSEDIDRKGNRGAIFVSSYAISYELPFVFKVAYDEENNRVIFLFKYIENPSKFTSIIKLDISVHLLIGNGLSINNLNTRYYEPMEI